MAGAARVAAPPLQPPRSTVPRGAHNPWLGYLRPNLWGKEKDPCTYSADFRGVFVAAPGATTQVDVQINGDSHFVATGLAFVGYNVDDVTPLAPSPALVYLKTSNANAPVMDRPVHIQNIGGDAELPAYFAFPMTLKPKEVLSVLLTNQEAVARNYHLSFLGFKVFGMGAQTPATALPASPSNPFLAFLPAKYWRLKKLFYYYTANFTGAFVAAGAGGITTLGLNIDGDSDFYVLGCNFTCFDATDLVEAITPSARVTVQDLSGGRLFTSAQGGAVAGQLPNSQHIRTFAGTGMNPGYWAMPRLVAGGSALQVSLQNAEAVARNYRLSFFGFKIFPQEWGEEDD